MDHLTTMGAYSCSRMEGGGLSATTGVLGISEIRTWPADILASLGESGITIIPVAAP